MEEKLIMINDEFIKLGPTDVAYLFCCSFVGWQEQLLLLSTVGQVTAWPAACRQMPIVVLVVVITHCCSKLRNYCFRTNGRKKNE